MDRDGLLQKVNLIVATGQNNLAMNRTVAQIARHYVRGNDIPEPMLNRIEHGIRCYDPCLSCSTHAVGQMPLHVQLIGPDGTVLERIARGYRSYQSAIPILVLGYGNTLRRDDGVGPKAADAIAALNLPGVRVLTCQQLAPELAEPIARFHRRFCGCCHGRPPRGGLARTGNRRYWPNFCPRLHPSALVALAGHLYGHRPHAWLLAIPATDLGIGDGLSPVARQGLDDAVRMIRSLSESWLVEA